MKEAKKILLVFILMLFLSLLATAQFDSDSENTQTVKLLATRGEDPGLIPIGEVRIWEDSDYLNIKYIITNADWRLNSTHVYVSSRNQEFAPIGDYTEPIRLELEQAHLAEMEYTYKIEKNWPDGTKFRVAAKAEVLAIQGYTSDIEGLLDSLPETVKVHATQPSSHDHAYFELTIMESEILDGFHYGWCFDIDRPNIKRWYEAKVYTLFDELPPHLMEVPENLDLVNWILNKDFVGKPSFRGGPYTFGDVQHCIWELLEGRTTNYTNGPWNIWRATEILDVAKAEGEGFIPAYNEKFLLILMPMNQNRRVHWASMGIGIPTPCLPVYTSETAWGMAWNISWYSLGPGLSFTIR